MSVSFWLDAADDGVRRPSLPGTLGVDVAIVGAGYTGLWTAWYLRRRDPSLRVAVLEARFAGFGASGRNGGWCSGNLGVTPPELARRTSPDAARAAYRAVRGAVDEIERVCGAEGLDVDWHRGGILRIARGPAQLPALERLWDGLSSLQLANGCVRLSAAELSARVRVARAEGAVFDPHGARLHPGKLVRGLARLVEKEGTQIYEDTEVTHVEPGGRVKTGRGEVKADVVVLAAEAWLSQLAATRRVVAPVYSLIVVTEPLPAEVWDGIGWRQAELLSSQRYTVDYLCRTAEGRILFGGRGAPYRYGSRISGDQDRHEATHAMLRARLVEWFPSLSGVRFDAAWGGPVGMPRDWMPTVDYDRRTGIAGAWGYTGQGVAMANLAGRLLASLILGEPTDDLPFLGHRSPLWEPEPLRWLGIRYVQSALARVDDRSDRSGRPPSGRSLAERLARH